MGIGQNNFAVSKTKNNRMLNSKSIGNKIAAARKKINLSQAELAQQVSISPQAVGKWERGESMPDITTLNRLAEILGVDLNYFSERFPSVDTETATMEPLKNQADEFQSSMQDKKPSWDMSSGNWVNADFSGLKNLHDKFSSSNIKNCKFVDSELSGLLLKSNNMDSCDFSSSDISSSKIQSSSVGYNNFKDCSLNETTFYESSIVNCDFTNADLTGVEIKSSAFLKNNMTDAILKRTTFKGTGIENIVFNGTLEDCYFENCGFSKVTFQNATLINTFFKNNKNLKKINFIECQTDRMTYEFLKSGKADLTGITLIS